MPPGQKKQRREDWRQRAKEMRSDFRDEFSNANRTQYYVGDPAPTPTDAPGGHGDRAQLARKLAARGDMRNQQLYDFVQQRNDLFRPGTGPDANLGGPMGPEPTLTGAMPPEDPNLAPPPDPSLAPPPVSAQGLYGMGGSMPPMKYGGLYNPGARRRSRPRR